MKTKHQSLLLATLVIALISITTLLYMVRTPRVLEAHELASPLKADNRNYTAITFNTEYWHHSESELIGAFNDYAYDFILLQEHLEKTQTGYTSTNRIAALEAVVGNYFVSANGEVVTVSRYPSMLQKNFGDGTAMRTDYQLAEDGILSIYNVHIPVHLHLDLLSTPAEFVKDLYNLTDVRQSLKSEIIADIENNDNNILVAGDFNTTVSMNTVNWFRKNMTDAYSAPNCTNRYGTWSLGDVISWRIDYVFLSPTINPESYCTIDLPDISDHKAIASVFYIGE
ncbi:endonuclease/exonuclease/phosphatase family protein [Marinobacter salarius]|uniref:endonuclease/exonuclease/phosphatase family protein n=1 Tax=Marinobacter salarius TaxID=1420917 RepID=UPI000F84FBE1|nr:endonuclease/exonuclease/phosphatase family protein [Marinobacter salarius]AZR43338.1 hypothetical protein MTMN5_03911 [Marinobacter salarius]